MLSVAVRVNFGMAISALERGRMDGMTEVTDNCPLRILICLHGGDLKTRMAFGAISLHGEGGFPVVTDTTGRALPHLCHSGALILLLVRFYHLWMTVFTTVNLDMEGMTESCLRYRRRRIAYFWISMAPTALIHLKSFLAIVAVPTRFAFGHIFHGHAWVFTGLVKSGVAYGAIQKLFQVRRMTEHRGTSFFYLEHDIFYLMAPAALMGIKGLSTVMAGAT